MVKSLLIAALLSTSVVAEVQRSKQISQLKTLAGTDSYWEVKDYCQRMEPNELVTDLSHRIVRLCRFAGILASGNVSDL